MVQQQESAKDMLETWTRVFLHIGQPVKFSLPWKRIGKEYRKTYDYGYVSQIYKDFVLVKVIKSNGFSITKYFAKVSIQDLREWKPRKKYPKLRFS